MIEMRQWVKLPSRWIEERGLRAFQWGRREGSSQAAALIAVAHRASLQEGLARIPYDLLTAATLLSRTKVADGLDVLAARSLVLRAAAGRSTYKLVNYENSGQPWAMLPARPLYSGGAITAFRDFHLRKKTELDALKIYLAFAARRDTEVNRAHMTDDQISAYTGVPEGRIKSALSILIHNNLIVVEQIERTGGQRGVSHAYRLAHLFPRRHQGTTGRAEIGIQAAEAVENRSPF